MVMMIMTPQIRYQKKHDTSVVLKKAPSIIANDHKARLFTPSADQHIAVTCQSSTTRLL